MTKPAPVVDVGPAEAAHLADAGTALLLDVRKDGEWSSGHAPQATHPHRAQGPRPLHRPAGPAGHRRLPQRQPLGPGGAGAVGSGADVRNPAGGMNAWAAAGLPVVCADGLPGEIA